MKYPNKKIKNHQLEIPPPSESNSQFYTIPSNSNIATSQINSIQLFQSLPLQPIIPSMMNPDPSSISGIPSASSIPLAQFHSPFNSKPTMDIPIIGSSQIPEVQPMLTNPNISANPSSVTPPVMVSNQDWRYNRFPAIPSINPTAIDSPLVQGVNNNSSATNMFIEQWRMPNSWADPSLLLNPNLPDHYSNLLSQSTSDLIAEDDELKHKRTGSTGKDHMKNPDVYNSINEEVQYNINDDPLSFINCNDTLNIDSLTFDEIQNFFDTNYINDTLTNNALSEIFSIQDSVQGCTTSASSNINGPNTKAKPSESKDKLERLKINDNCNYSFSYSSPYNAPVPSLTNNSNTTATGSTSDPNSGKESSKSGSPSNKEDQSCSGNDEKQGYQRSTQSNSNYMEEEEKASDQENQAEDRPKERGKRGRQIQLKCPTCKKIFTRPSSFQTHQLSHSGEKPYPCPVPGCDKRFSVPSNQRRHLKVHKKRLERLKNEDIPFNHGTELLELYFSGAYPQIFDEEPILVRNAPSTLSSRQSSFTSTFTATPHNPTRSLQITGDIGEANVMVTNPTSIEDPSILHTPSSPTY